MIGERAAQSLSGSGVTSRYAVLSIDNLGLLIPQHQLHALEPGFDVERHEGDALGWIAVAGVRSPVYCLSDELKPIREVPRSRRICALLDIGATLVGLLCDQVTMLEQAGIEILPLPECMRTPGTPLHGLALHAERVLCVTSAQHLLAGAAEPWQYVGPSLPARRREGRAS